MGDEDTTEALALAVADASADMGADMKTTGVAFVPDEDGVTVRLRFDVRSCETDLDALHQLQSLVDGAEHALAEGLNVHGGTNFTRIGELARMASDLERLGYSVVEDRPLGRDDLWYVEAWREREPPATATGVGPVSALTVLHRKLTVGRVTVAR